MVLEDLSTRTVEKDFVVKGCAKLWVATDFFIFGFSLPRSTAFSLHIEAAWLLSPSVVT
jgi:hypothetical protein